MTWVDFVVGFLLVDFGVFLGWCLRSALTRAQLDTQTPTPQE